MFSHRGRFLDGNQSAADAGLENYDEIVAVEMMDLTADDMDEVVPVPQRELLKKNWPEHPEEAKKAMEDIFDIVVRDRLRDLLRQYELRERHFETVIRSKELEVLLAKARAEEQKHLADMERQVSRATDTQNLQLQQSIESMHASQSRLMDKLIACCKEPNGERSQRLFTFLGEELQKRGAKFTDEEGEEPDDSNDIPPYLLSAAVEG